MGNPKEPPDEDGKEGPSGESAAGREAPTDAKRAKVADKTEDAEGVGDKGGVSDYLASEIGALDSMRNEEE